MRESFPARFLETAPVRCRGAVHKSSFLILKTSPCRSIFYPTSDQRYFPKLLKTNGLSANVEKMRGAHAPDSEANSLFHNILAVSPFDARICADTPRSGTNNQLRMNNLQDEQQKNVQTENCISRRSAFRVKSRSKAADLGVKSEAPGIKSRSKLILFPQAADLSLTQNAIKGAENPPHADDAKHPKPSHSPIVTFADLNCRERSILFGFCKRFTGVVPSAVTQGQPQSGSGIYFTRFRRCQSCVSTSHRRPQLSFP